MSRYPNSDYQRLVAQHMSAVGRNRDEPARRRRKPRCERDDHEADNFTPEPQDVISVKSESDSSDDDDFEDVDLNLPRETHQLPPIDDKPLVISLAPAPQPIKKRKLNHISKEQRVLRKQMHQIYIVMMVVHGGIRNRWCNDYDLMTSLKKRVPSSISQLLITRDKTVLDVVKSRRLLDGLKQLMTLFNKNLHLSSKGLILKNWHELGQIRSNCDKNVTFEKFKELVLNHRGSRDIAAQGFVSLLRSFGLNARLVFSLQPPDFTSTVDTSPPVETDDHVAKKTTISRLNDSKNSLLASVRSQSQTTSEKSEKKPKLQDSEIPIFWVEVWDSYTSKWVSVDPICMKIIEIPPKRRKCSFEPPSTDPRNQLVYAIAYDRLGGVKDVTRRYTHYYNAKTIRKRIDNRSDEDEFWYQSVIRAANSNLKVKGTRVDAIEMKEFHDRDLAEGMPDNMSEFKNHPLYALESQLKQNEVIYPKDNTSKCGTFRARGRKNSETVFTVYKRSHVYSLKSAKAWYMRGRVLKVGVQPLKLKKKTGVGVENDEDEEEDTRLYGEFQTQMYIPPRIVDGKVPKNAFGNVDCFTPNMIPENGYLVSVEKYPIKLSEMAANIIGIDYAKAIVAFDFTNRRSSRMPTAKEGGILIDKQYKEAILLVVDQLIEEQEQASRKAQELRALKFWKHFLTKLRINDRLNKQHGRLEDDSEAEDEQSEAYSVHSDTSGSDVEGGFIDAEFKGAKSMIGTDDERRTGTKSSASVESSSDDVEYMGESQSGGFMLDASNNSGFIVDDYHMDNADDSKRNPNVHDNNSDDDAGGFILEDSDERTFTAKDDEDDASVGGGFLPESTNAEQYSIATPIHNTNEARSGQEESDEMPDEFFRYDESGELVYDPGNKDFAASTDAAEKVAEAHEETAARRIRQVKDANDDLANTKEAENENDNERDNKNDQENNNENDNNYEHEGHDVESIQVLTSKERDNDGALSVHNRSSVSSNGATPSYSSESIEDEFGFEYDSD